jgi:tRNA-modifying protein YgfZ
VATNGYRLLTEQVALRITGDDAETWLNGQVTNNVATLPPGAAVYALVVSIKGKIEADAFVARADEGFWMVVDRSTVERLMARFDAQIIMEDVTVSATDRAVLSVIGSATLDAFHYRADRLGREGTDYLVESSELAAAIERLEAQAAPAIDADTWERTRIEHGRPRFGLDFGPANYPQEAGLRDLAVSFTKGCYVGQEVVCTLENRGRLSKRLLRLGFAAEPDRSTDVLVDGTGKEVGAITSRTRREEGILALGYVRGSGPEYPAVFWDRVPAEILGPAGI